MRASLRVARPEFVRVRERVALRTLQSATRAVPQGEIDELRGALNRFTDGTRTHSVGRSRVLFDDLLVRPAPDMVHGKPFKVIETPALLGRLDKARRRQHRCLVRLDALAPL